MKDTDLNDLNDDQLAKLAEEVEAGPNLVTTQPASSCRSIADWLADPETLNPPPRVSSNFPVIDHALGGGFVAGGLYLIVGLTGKGKSALATNLARRMASNGTRTLLISLEDDPRSVVRKLLAQDGRQPMLAVERINDQGIDARHKRAVMESASHLALLPLEIEGEVCELPALSKLITEKADANTKVVILDQSSWVVVPGAENAYNEATKLVRSLKAQTKSLKIVLIVVVQVNRAGAYAQVNRENIELHHIRETGRWEQDADGVLVIQNVDASTTPATLTLDLKKHRHGPKEVTCPLLFTLEQGLVEDDPSSPESQKTYPKLRGSDRNSSRDSGWTTENFAQEFYSNEPKSLDVILARAKGKGIRNSEAKQLHALVVDEGKVFPQPRKGNEAATFSTVPAPPKPEVPKSPKRPPGRPRKNNSRERAKSPHTPTDCADAPVGGEGISNSTVSKPQRKRRINKPRPNGKHVPA